MRVRLWRVWVVGLLALMLALALPGCSGSPTSQWQSVGPGDAQISALAADPHQRGLLFAGGNNGSTFLARGDRSGQFVPSAKSPGGSGPVGIIFPNPYVRGRVYAGTTGGFFSSSDYGEHYAPQNRGLPSTATITAITTGPDATTLFVGVAEKGLYTSLDGGASWKAVVPAPASATNVLLPASGTIQVLLWEDASKSLYAAVSDTGGGVYVSHDRGVTWSASTDGLPAKTNVYALVEMPSGGLAASGPTLYAGTSAGVFARPVAAGSAKWQSAGTGLPSGSVYSLATYSETPGLLYAGTDQAVYSSTDGGQHWQQVADSLSHQVPAIAVVPGQANPTVTYAVTGQILRYPPGNAGGGGFLGTLLLVVIVGASAWYVLAHWGFVPGIREVRRWLASRINTDK